jgi:quercetin dioxygenase-like cupin family protein
MISQPNPIDSWGSLTDDQTDSAKYRAARHRLSGFPDKSDRILSQNHLGGNSMTDASFPTMNSYSVHEDQLKWFDVPLVTGGKAAVLFGDPTKAGTVVLRFKFPPNRQTPPHRHPYAELTTILSGKVYYGEGEKFDSSNPAIGKVGTFAVVPAGQAHFVWTLDEEAIVQLQFEGPSTTIYVDAADDPRRK